MKFSSLRIAVLCFALVTAPRIPTCVAAGAGGNKEYVVFLGLNVSAGDRVQQFPVVGGNERDIVMSRSGEIVTVPRREVGLRAAMEPKLSRNGVVVEALTGEPVHSPATNPMVDAQSQLIAMQNVDMDRQEASEQALRQALDAAGAAVAAAAMVPADSPDRGAAEARAVAANELAVSAGFQTAAVVANPRFGEFLPGSEGDGGAFDGFEVTFRISAPEPRSDAYGVLRLFLEDSLQPASPHKQLLKLFRLRTVDATPRKIIVRSLGLPPGMTVESYEVHVYVNGEELATNNSLNRVEVTADEAHQFLILRHIHAHRGQTVSARIAGELRSKAPALATGQAETSIVLGITADGRVSDLNVMAIGSERLPPEIESAVRDVRFLPALVDGQPLASTGSFALGEMFH